MKKKQPKDYTFRSMYREREYSFSWYSVLWSVLRPILVGVCALLITAGVIAAVWNHIYTDYFAPVDSSDDTEVIFQITSGQSLTRVANNLEDAELIRSHTVFKYYCDFSGFGQKIQSGTYVLNRTMTIDEIADQLTRGDGTPMVRNITLIPGETIEEFAEKLYTSGVITDKADFLSLCRSGRSFSDFYYISDVLKTKNVDQRRYVLEGYLAPNTYEVYTNATNSDIIRKLLSQTEAVYTDAYAERAEALGMTMDQVLTLASMIEKEAGASDMAKVSAVFHNRIKAGMKLQSDVTIHYVTGVHKMALTENDLRVSSLYNTYVCSGLPLGPICNPSPAAIAAALYPDDAFIAEKYLYFCAKDPASGELYFSRTLAEHEQAVAIYAPLWQAYDQERGIQ